ncbi:MAG: hypothetical protein HY674_03505 [Chloroflexi bacterium]|nr:hypothetical protein [Chloroflexota bacterium]
MVPALLGFLLGGQQIYAKQGSDFFNILRTGWGVGYWLSRMLIPAGGYLLWYCLQDKPQHSLWAASAWGLGSEMVIRTKFYFGTRSAPDGKPDDIFKGVFDLVDWWQKFALEKANIALADGKQKVVNGLTETETDFRNLCQRVKSHANSLDDEQRAKVVEKADEGLATFNTEGGTALRPEQQREHVRVLCYGLLKLVGRRGLKLLIRRD